MALGMHTSFQKAESKGKFFLASIKGKYAFTKIEPQPETKEQAL